MRRRRGHDASEIRHSTPPAQLRAEGRNQIVYIDNMVAVHPRLAISQEQIAAFCQKWKIVRLELFGSVLRDDFDEQSDIDLLVTFATDFHPYIRDYLAMEDELRQMFGRQVDLIKRQLIETSRNWVRRRNILKDTQLIYAAT